MNKSFGNRSRSDAPDANYELIFFFRFSSIASRNLSVQVMSASYLIT